MKVKQRREESTSREPGSSSEQGNDSSKGGDARPPETSDSGGKPGGGGRFWGVLREGFPPFGLLLLIIFVSPDALRGPAPEPTAPPPSFPGWSWWTSPVERNRVLRLPQAYQDLARTPSGHLWVVSASGTVVRSTDGGRHWEVRRHDVRDQLTAIHFSDDNNGWVVGRRSTPSDRTMAQPHSTTSKDLRRRTGSLLLHTSDGGESWQEQILLAEGWLQGVFFRDRNNGWVVGRGKEHHNGKVDKPAPAVASDKKPPSGSTDEEDDEDLIFHFRSLILHTSDGGKTWKQQHRLGSGDLHDIFFLDMARGWAVGVYDTWSDPRKLTGSSDHVTAPLVLFTTDGGRRWTQAAQQGPLEMPAASIGVLRAVKFQDAKTGWAAGIDEFPPGQPGAVPLTGLLKTTDGGKRWKEVTATPAALHQALGAWRPAGPKEPNQVAVLQVPPDGEDGQPALAYRRLPAPLYFLLWVSFFGLLAYTLVRRPRRRQGDGIAEELVADSPVLTFEQDRLGFSGLARGISDFIRNERTHPPLTFAVTAPWGMGKSSLLRLVKAHLEDHGYRPVWFNAWHCQKDEQFMAGLLEALRQDGVPSLWSPLGWFFRLALVGVRLRRHWPFSICLAVYLAATAAAGGEPLALNVSPFSAETSLRALDIAFSGGLLVSLLSLLKASQVLAVGSLWQWLRGLARLSGEREKVGMRRRFAREFADLNTALRWSPHRASTVIIIDDLDRCSPQRVLEVLESVNFICTCGEAFILIGLDVQKVTAYVAAGLAKVADNLPQKDPDFAQHYVQKMLNVHIPVPRVSRERLASLTRNPGDAAGDRRTPQFRRWVRRNGLKMVGGAAIGLLLGVSVLALGALGEGNQKQGPTVTRLVLTGGLKAPASPKTPAGSRDRSGESPASKPGATGEAKPEGDDAKQPDSKGKDKAAPSETSGSENEGKAGSDETVAAAKGVLLALLALLLLALLASAIFGKRVARKLAVIIKDRPDFSREVNRWLPVVEASQDHPRTPRSLKQFINEARFLSMCERQMGRDGNLDGHATLPLPALIGLRAMDWFRQGLAEDPFLVKKVLPLWRSGRGDALAFVKNEISSLKGRQKAPGKQPAEEERLARLCTILALLQAAGQSAGDLSVLWPDLSELEAEQALENYLIYRGQAQFDRPAASVNP